MSVTILKRFGGILSFEGEGLRPFKHRGNKLFKSLGRGFIFDCRASLVVV